MIDSISRKDNPLVITFSDFSYIELAIEWYNKFKKLNIKNYTIISTDKEAFEVLVSKNINTKLEEYNNKVNFWEYRMRVLTKYLNENNNIVHSDLDAIWNKNIIQELNDDRIDIYYSQGTTFPEISVIKNGFVLCCGFFYIRYNDRTLSFFNALLNKTAQIGDDQDATNRLLNNTQWAPPDNFYSREHESHTYRYYKDEVRGYNEEFKLNISLISMFKIQRQLVDDSGYVYHILTPKDCGEKIKHFKNLKLL